MSFDESICLLARMCMPAYMCVYVCMWESTCSIACTCEYTYGPVCVYECVHENTLVPQCVDVCICLWDGTLVLQCVHVCVYEGTLISAMMCTSVCVYFGVHFCHSVPVEVLGIPPVSILTFYLALDVLDEKHLFFRCLLGLLEASYLNSFCASSCSCLTLCVETRELQLCTTCQAFCECSGLESTSSHLHASHSLVLTSFQRVYSIHISWFWKCEKVYTVWRVCNFWGLCLLFKKTI